MVHCVAGRDRTCVLVALLLQVAGVANDVIAADYALSGNSTAPMMKTLDHLHNRYGGALPHLFASGVAERELAAARKRVLG